MAIFNSYVTNYQRVVFFFIFDKQNLCHICHDHLVYSGDMSSIAGIERNHGSRSLLHHWNVSLIARCSSAFSSDVPHKNLFHMFHFSFTGATGCFSPLSQVHWSLPVVLCSATSCVGGSTAPWVSGPCGGFLLEGHQRPSLRAWFSHQCV